MGKMPEGAMKALKAAKKNHSKKGVNEEGKKHESTESAAKEKSEEDAAGEEGMKGEEKDLMGSMSRKMKMMKK